MRAGAKKSEPNLIYGLLMKEVLPQAFYDISTEQSAAQTLHHIQH